MFGIYTLIFGIFLALLEIEIEWKNGWAQNLPTWRKVNTKAPMSFLRNLTGYHSTLMLMILCLHHVVFIGFYWYFWPSDEFFILAFYFFLLIFWDFLWFVLNPHFTLKKFKKEHIIWYTDSKWIFGFPIDYWYGIIGSIILALFGWLVQENALIFVDYILTGILGTLIWGVTIVVSPLYHRWYHFMRK